MVASTLSHSVFFVRALANDMRWWSGLWAFCGAMIRSRKSMTRRRRSRRSRRRIRDEDDNDKGERQGREGGGDSVRSKAK